MTEKVIIGMSGGVDSAVAAKLLVADGYNVEAIYMKNWEEDDFDQQEICTSKEDMHYAQNVCDELKIPLHTVNFASEYWDNVFEAFINSYNKGHTPNPDILCNKEIKFKVFLDYAKKFKADKIATGHYASVSYQDKKFFLSKSKDTNKDQTYFLYTLNQDQLSQTLFPLQDLKKNQVRDIAKKNNFRCYDRKDSTGICFIGERNFNKFISKYVKNKKGGIYDSNNNRIGNHEGMSYLTIGQRSGLGIGGKKNSKELPWYVYKKDITKNQVYVCQGSDNDLLFHKKIIFNQLNLISHNVEFLLSNEIEARIRHRGELKKCIVKKYKKNHFCIEFNDRIWAPAIGQSVVFYHKDICLGGGVIIDF